jgi:hypothetical protein
MAGSEGANLAFLEMIADIFSLSTI